MTPNRETGYVLWPSPKAGGPPGCAVIVAEFYNFDQRCGWPSVTTIDHGSENWPVCPKHLREALGAVQ